MLEKRVVPSQRMMVASPILAVLLTLATSAFLLVAMDQDPIMGLYILFIDPLTQSWALEEILVKTTPLALIAAGLSLCFTANVWNIGAEGQFILGAIFGATLPVLLPDFHGPQVLPLMLVLGFLGGTLFGLIPALFKVRFGANEILTSLMLVYVAELLLDYLVRGPWRDPHGLNFPKTIAFHDWASMPQMGADRLNIGLLIAIFVALILTFFMMRTLRGFGIRVTGAAPRAAEFAGFRRDKTIYFVLAVSGGLAGLAGIIEVAGPINQLHPAISPGYGFTAIIVAFLGRLNPIGALIAAFILSISYIGAENAQIFLKITNKVTHVFQGILLFFILACDTLITYRLRFRNSAKRAKADA